MEKLKEFVSGTVPNVEINVDFHRILDKKIKYNRRRKTTAFQLTSGKFIYLFFEKNNFI